MQRYGLVRASPDNVYRVMCAFDAKDDDEAQLISARIHGRDRMCLIKMLPDPEPPPKPAWTLASPNETTP